MGPGIWRRRKKLKELVGLNNPLHFHKGEILEILSKSKGDPETLKMLTTIIIDIFKNKHWWDTHEECRQIVAKYFEFADELPRELVICVQNFYPEDHSHEWKDIKAAYQEKMAAIQSRRGFPKKVATATALTVLAANFGEKFVQKALATDGGMKQKGWEVAPIQLRTYVSSSFKWRTRPRNEFHKGVDIVARKGTPIIAPFAGMVEKLEPNGKGRSGNCVQIDSTRKWGIKQYFFHLTDVSPKLKLWGQVKSGDEIGTVGSTGDTTGDHLHYELVIKDRPLFARMYNISEHELKQEDIELGEQRYYEGKTKFDVNPNFFWKMVFGKALKDYYT